MPIPGSGILIGALRAIASASPDDDGERCEDYETFASRLKRIAREAVKKFDRAVAEESARMESERRSKE
jgi:hypothetical protein